MSTPEPMTTHPSDETLAAFIDQRLDAPARRRVIEHMSVCGDCREIVVAVPSDSEVDYAPKRSATSLVLISSFATAATLALIFYFTPLRDKLVQPPDGIAGLVDASESLDYRRIEGRLTGGFPHRKLHRTQRSSQDLPRSGEWRLWAAADQIQKRAEGADDVETLHALGVSYLVTGKTSDALTAFERALHRENGARDLSIGISTSKNPVLLNDISAALLTMGLLGKLEALPLAGEAAERAWELEKSPEAAWNRALALEALKNRDAARAAWQDYLGLDRGSAWATEARERLNRLEAPPRSEVWTERKGELERAAITGDSATAGRWVREFPLQARRWAEDELFPAWATATSRGSTKEAAKLWAVCSAIAASLKSGSGEELLDDALRHADRLQSAKSQQFPRLLFGLESYGLARKAYGEQRIADARRSFNEAHSAFVDTGSPLARAAELYRAGCDYYRNDYAAVERTLSSLLDPAYVEPRYQAVTASLYWLRARAKVYAGQGEAAIEDYKRTLALAQKLGERETVMDMHDLMSEILLQLGNVEDAIWHRQQAMHLLAISGATVRKQVLLIGAARATLALGAPRMAVSWLNLQIAQPSEPRYFNLRANGLIWRSRIQASLGRAGAAATDLDEAILLIQQIPDADIRQQASSTVEYVADRLGDRDGETAQFAVIQQAIDYAEKSSNRFRLAHLYLLDGRAQRRAGRDDAAERAFLRAVAEIEAQRGLLSDDELRSTFFGGSTGAYEELTRLYADRGDAVRAFLFAERARARTLLDRIADTGRPRPPARSVADICSRISSETAVVEFAVLENEILTWVLTPHSFRMYRSNTPRTALTALVQSHVDAIGRRQLSLLHSSGKRLSSILIEQWAGNLSASNIVFVPHGPLNELPFATLPDGTEKYLVSRFSMSIAPSVEVLLGILDRRMTGRPNAAGTLIVAASMPVDTTLASLAGAASEATDLANLYPKSTVLAGAQATVSKFLEKIRATRIMHFSGHARSATDSGSRIVLYDAELSARDIESLDLRGTELAFLGACASALEVDRYQQGVSSIAKAFLAAGAATVVGTLWPIADAPAADFGNRFHKHFARGESAAAALRRAQLEAIASSDDDLRDPRTWSAFIVIGWPGQNEERRHV